MFISWMLIMPIFKKSLIVEQFQGNYLKYFRSFFNTQSPVHSAYFILLNTDSTKTKISKKQNRASHGFKI